MVEVSAVLKGMLRFPGGKGPLCGFKREIWNTGCILEFGVNPVCKLHDLFSLKF